MREESHLDEMRDAIRGDFERLAARRGEQDLMRLSEAEAPHVHEEPEQLEDPPEEPENAEPEHESEPELSRRSWLERLFST